LKKLLQLTNHAVLDADNVGGSNVCAPVMPLIGDYSNLYALYAHIYIYIYYKRAKKPKKRPLTIKI
jgi:hypothetical protein